MALDRDGLPVAGDRNAREAGSCCNADNNSEHRYESHGDSMGDPSFPMESHSAPWKSASGNHT